MRHRVTPGLRIKRERGGLCSSAYRQCTRPRRQPTQSNAEAAGNDSKAGVRGLCVLGPGANRLRRCVCEQSVSSGHIQVKQRAAHVLGEARGNGLHCCPGRRYIARGCATARALLLESGRRCNCPLAHVPQAHAGRAGNGFRSKITQCQTDGPSGEEWQCSASHGESDATENRVSPEDLLGKVEDPLVVLSKAFPLSEAERKRIKDERSRNHQQAPKPNCPQARSQNRGTRGAMPPSSTRPRLPIDQIAYGTGVTKCAATLKTSGPAADISGEREIWILGGSAASA